MRARSAVCFLILSALWVGVRADEASERAAYGRMKAERQLVYELFKRAHEEFGKRGRIWAVLSACGKSGIADSINSNGDEKAKFLASELQTIKHGDDANARFANSLSGDEVVDLLQRAVDQTIMYDLGYMEAVTTDTTVYPGLCDRAVESADKIMQERAKK